MTRKKGKKWPWVAGIGAVLLAIGGFIWWKRKNQPGISTQEAGDDFMADSTASMLTAIPGAQMPTPSPKYSVSQHYVQEGYHG